MRLALAALLVYGGDVEKLRAQLKAGDVLRTVNAPWCAFLPRHEEADPGYTRLKKLTLALSMQRPVFFFSYSENGEFTFDLVSKCKRAAGLTSARCAPKIGGLIDQMMGDERASAALKMWSGCCSREEKLCLLEQTLGTALYDAADMPERVVERSTAMMEVILGRAKPVKKRRKKYELVPVEQEEWPRQLLMDMRARAQLAAYSGEFVWQGDSVVGVVRKPQWWRWGSFELYGRRQNGVRRLAFFDEEQDRIQLIESPDGALLCKDVLWVTLAREPVLMQFNASRKGIGALVCLKDDGEVRWRFAPKATGKCVLEPAHVSESGVITVLAQTSLDKVQLWRVDGESGQPLARRELSGRDIPASLTWVPEMKCFAAYAPQANGLILLSETLEIEKRIALNEASKSLHVGALYSGKRIWHVLPNKEKITVIDLENGRISSIQPEGGGRVNAVLPDGNLVSVGRKLCVYDDSGRLLAQHTLKNGMPGFVEEEGGFYVVEIGGVTDYAYLGDDTLNHPQYFVWRLEKQSMQEK